MNKKLFIYILFIFNLVLNADEVSVFGAGDLDSSTPYGLTDSEKVILTNKKKLTKFDRKIDDTRSSIDTISERIDGLESIVSGDSKKLHTTSNKLSKLILQNKSKQAIYTQLNEMQDINTKELASLKKEVKKLKETLYTLIRQIDKEFKQNDKEYVTKKQFNELVNFINKEFDKNNKPKKKKKIKDNRSNKELLSDAKRLFNKDYFTKSIIIFEKLIAKKYKPAESNFYLGEIWFNRKKYKDAIAYYKTSMTLYDQAKYIPKLLLHSAMSFEKLKDLENASNFYGTLVDVYPETQEAKEAQQKLAKIN